MVWRTERGKKLVVTLSKTPPSQKQACDIPRTAFEVSPFITEELGKRLTSHISLNENTFEVSAIKLLKVKEKRTTEFDQFERCVCTNHKW